MTLRRSLIRLAHQKKELQPDLLPLLKVGRNEQHYDYLEEIFRKNDGILERAFFEKIFTIPDPLLNGLRASAQQFLRDGTLKLLGDKKYVVWVPYIC